MKRTIHPLLLLAVTILGALWHEVQPAQSQGHIFANPPMLSSHDGWLDVELTAAPGTYIILNPAVVAEAAARFASAYNRGERLTLAQGAAAGRVGGPSDSV